MPFQDVTNLAQRRGLFFPSAEIYSNAPSGFYEYGPEGVKLKNRLVQKWRKMLIENEQNLEIDGSIILPESVFKASGHLDNFNDPIVICETCKTPYRADKLIEEHFRTIRAELSKHANTENLAYAKELASQPTEIPEGAPLEYYDTELAKLKIVCPKDKKPFPKSQRFNMMMKVEIGATKGNPGYLRPEACQSIFLDFIRLWKSGRVKLPIGIGQAGKAFRNEIAPRQGLLRTRELEQMDVEVFFNPTKINEVEKWEDVKDYHLNLYLLKDKQVHSMTCHDAVENKIVSGKLVAYYLARTQQFFHSLNIPIEKMRFRELEAEARAFYAHETWDFEVRMDEMWVELGACNYRTDHDLKMHGNESKQDLSVKEDGPEPKFIPHIFEISLGVGRTLLLMLDSNFKKELRGTEERTFLDLPADIAPAMVGVYPLMKKDGMSERAEELHEHLLEIGFASVFDESGSIGKRYARADEVGIPYALTVDYQSMEDRTVTIRERTSTTQKRVLVDDLDEILWKFNTGNRKFDDLAD